MIMTPGEAAELINRLVCEMTDFDSRIIRKIAGALLKRAEEIDLQDGKTLSAEGFLNVVLAETPKGEHGVALEIHAEGVPDFLAWIFLDPDLARDNAQTINEFAAEAEKKNFETESD
jgi:hypothetical protein